MENRDYVFYFGEVPTETQGVTRKLIYIKKGDKETAIVSDPFEGMFHLFPNKEEIKNHFEKNNLSPFENLSRKTKKKIDKLFKKAERYGDDEKTHQAIKNLLIQMQTQ